MHTRIHNNWPKHLTEEYILYKLALDLFNRLEIIYQLKSVEIWK